MRCLLSTGDENVPSLIFKNLRIRFQRREEGPVGLPCVMRGPDAMRKELAAITSQTRRPLNVNFSAMYCLKQIPSESSLAAPATIVILT